MNKYLLCKLFIACCITTMIQCLPPDNFLYGTPRAMSTNWLIVGAGPAGLSVIAVLLDIGVDPQQITWMDPHFNLGRLGEYYGNVPSNNTVQDFINFLGTCACFQECAAPAIEKLRQSTDLTSFPLLQAIIEPLQCITQHLCSKVRKVQSSMTTLNFEHSTWKVETSSHEIINAQHVILATGSHPKTLSYKTEQIIPLDIALDPQNLREIITQDDIVAVVGDSHSAVLLLKFLSEIPVKHIYNFYKNPITYATNFDGWLINGSTGLKGIAAEWARTILERNPPANLTRLKSTPSLLEHMLTQCSKTIYAIGFERNDLPPLTNAQGVETPIEHYNPTNGVIAPRLFGIGIAFPEKITNQYGKEETRIGLESFMKYAHHLVPQWVHDDFFKKDKRDAISTQMKKLSESSDLFAIWTL